MKSAYKYMAAIAALCFVSSFPAAADELTSSALAEKEKILGRKKFREHEAKIEEQNHKFPDGAYGFGWGYIPGRIYKTDSVSKEVTPRQLNSLYCGSEAIVVATLLNSHSFLNDEESLVLTAWRFKVVNALKADKGLSMGKIISLVMPGGEVIKNSKKLRIKNTFIGEYEKKKKYLLFLDRQTDETSPVYFTYQPKLEVSAGQVTFASHDSWLGYASGFRIDDLMKDVGTSLEKHPCQ